MQRVVTLCLAVLLAWLPAAAMADVTRGELEASVDRVLTLVGKPHVGRLRNGLAFIVQPLPEQTRVAVVVSYRGGSRDDPRGRNGVAHTVEHMTFRGSRHLEAYGSMRLVEAQGGRVAAYTTAETTDYVDVVPSGDLLQALWIESERMAFTVERFSAAALAHERRLIEHEYALRNKVRDSFELELNKLLFGEDHPNAMASIRSLGPFVLSDIEAFYRNFYRPENATVIVAGAVDPAFAEKELERYFGSIWNPIEPVWRPKLPLVLLRPPRRVRFTTGSTEQIFAARWVMPDVTLHERLALDVLASMLARSLDLALVTADRARSVRVDVQAYPDTSVFSITASVGADQAMGPLEFALREEVERFWTSDLSVGLDATKSLLTLRLVEMLQDPSAYALGVSHCLAIEGARLDVEQRVRELRAVTEGELLVLRARFLHPLFAWLSHAPPKRSS